MKKKRSPRPDRTTAKERRVAVIWTRVSTKEQVEHNLSLETQEKACKDYAKRLGIEVVRIMGQTNESAKTEGKLYREMIAYVSSNRQRTSGIRRIPFNIKRIQNRLQRKSGELRRILRLCRPNSPEIEPYVD